MAQVSPGERELLGFVIPWICRSGGNFCNKSKGAPSYSMEMMFEPNDEFKAGDRQTALSKTAVPPALGGVTGLSRYLHALAGEPVTHAAPLLDETSEPPSFACRVDFNTMNDAFARLQSVLTAAALDALQADLRQHERAADLPQTPVAGVTGAFLGVLDTPNGRIVIGGRGPNRYADVDALAILDLGGDDEYVYRHPETLLGKRPVQVIVDFAGDDVYQTQGVGGPGAGLLSIGILIDRAGNDRYCQGLSARFQPRAHTRQTLVQPDPEGVQTGLVPFARLYGNPDQPDEKGVALDAGFAFGAGLLGIGVLVDEAGDDLYLGQKFAFGCGFWHGVGVLHDASGADVYAAGLATIGAGINGAFGLLDDRAGDNHNGWSGNHGRGNGCHRGVGYLLDRLGNDRYSASSLGGGTAWDMASGFLLDLGGDDVMTDLHGKSQRGNTGWGAAKGFAVSFHCGGADVYERATFGDAASIGDGYPGKGGDFAFFLDVGPEIDSYPQPDWNNRTRLSGVSWSKEADGKEYPQGIGLFLDGPDVLTTARDGRP